MRELSDLLRRPLGVVLTLQLGWWSAVGGAALGAEALGPFVVAGLLFAQIHSLGRRQARLTWFAVAALAVVGTSLDSLQSSAGLVRFAGADGTWLAPLWITALWAHFATALDAVASLCHHRRWALALGGALGGPLAYWGGARLGAVDLHPQVWPSLLSLAAEWALVLPLAWSWMRWMRRASEPASEPSSA